VGRHTVNGQRDEPEMTPAIAADLTTCKAKAHA
jgi:hypothetical protein